MEKIERKINGFIGMTIASTLILTALGLIFFIFPGAILNVLRWIMVAILVTTGFGMILRSASRNGSAGIVVGIIFFMLGLLIAMHPETLNIVMIILGLYMIITSVSSLLFMQNMRNTTVYTMTIISNIIGLICGVILFVHPGESTEMIMQIAGVLMMIYGISGLIEAMTIKARVDDVKENFKSAKKSAKSLLDNAKEAKIVDKKSKK
ncbi:MAG: DUF308 domain-containing protein [Candidatus Saccharibacteria bacterium]|nr:DUF308 domain-containing protein [Candidatus Saccharibacteria bacterium]MDO4967574.1 DUF308 domain-containing protein [Candidatus Saccharibacteria bacterium]